MRLHAPFLGGALVSLAIPLALALQSYARAGLTHPNPGVVCNTAGRRCQASYGPSAGVTEDTFGPEAAEGLARHLCRPWRQRRVPLRRRQAGGHPGFPLPSRGCHPVVWGGDR
jgi:hypothetical protein